MTNDNTPNTLLATYGTLARGRANHHQLGSLTGTWRHGAVRGELVHEGWGAAMGAPGLVLNPNGSEVDVELFESVDLPLHWARLDAFEGEGYRRVVTQVVTSEGPRDAHIYVLAAYAKP